MEYYIIMCRSMTFAQRAVRALEREGIKSGIIRAPHGLSPEGCSYAVKLASKKFEAGAACIKRYGIPVGRAYRIGENGASEVVL